MHREKGVALILALLLVLAMSVIAVSLMFVSQTETWSSLNYRLMSQSRDGAEGGVDSAANYLINTYSPPTGAALANYTQVWTPEPEVTYGGNAVYLSASGNQSSNYPDSSVQSTFNSTGVGKGSMTAGNTAVSYASYAKLVNQYQITPYGTATPATIQTWLITSDGTVSGVRAADEEVTARLEREVFPVFSYAAFATNSGCSALDFGGGGITNSYNSSSITYTSSGAVASSTFSATDGNVGTNGNLTTQGNPTTINGNLSTPRTGVGSCTTNNVTAWTDSSGTVNGQILELPQTVVYPTPVIPPAGMTNESISSSVTLQPGSYGDITLSGHGVLTLEPNCPAPPAVPSPSNCTPGVYNVNSISESGANTSIIISPIPGYTPTTYLPIIVNVSGVNQATPISLTGNSLQNPSLNPMNFQLLYAGTGTIKLAGGSNASGLLYAPNASYSFTGGSDWYGAVIGASMTDMGGTAIHYDRRLADEAFTVGPWMLDSFSWQKN